MIPALGSDGLTKALTDIRSRNDDVRARAAKSLRNFVEAEAREVSGESFAKFFESLHKRINDLLNSPEPNDKIGGIVAVDELIDVDCEENANNIARFANYLRNVLPNSDAQTVVYASRALGHLARAGGALATDFVEFEVKRALEWLPVGDRDKAYETRRHAAVLVLKELAENAPTLFYVHVTAFFEHIWVAFRDSKAYIREGAAEALRATVALIAKRESRLRSNWYFRTWEEAGKGFKSGNTDQIHGALLIVGELVRNAGDFMVSRFQDACDYVLRYRDSRDRLLRRTVIPLLPRLASFCPEPFVRYYLPTALAHLLTLIRAGTDRAPAYIAVGEIAMGVGEAIGQPPHLETIIVLIKEGITHRRRPFCPEALTCLSMLARAGIAPLLEDYMNDLLEPMFSVGLSTTLVEALTDITTNIPDILPKVQDRLLDEISRILDQRSYRHPGTPAYYARPVGHTHTSTGPQDVPLVTLALSTLGSFDFSSHSLSEFVRDCIVMYLEDENPAVRKEAAHTCSRLLVPLGMGMGLGFASTKKGHYLPSIGPVGLGLGVPKTGNYLAKKVVGVVVEKLLNVAVADPDASIRLHVLRSLDKRFDQHLAQGENLRLLFIALNDEVYEIREVAITTIGRLTSRNPALVMPALRNTLIHLLTELDYSAEIRNKEESARLLGLLIGAFQRLIKPYVPPILKVLVSKVHDSSTGVAACVLATLGELAAVGGTDMAVYMDDLLPLVIDALQDQSSAAKREIALRTLGNLVRSTGCVVQPYLKYPPLLNMVLNCIKGEPLWGIRREAMNVLGVIGALDPFKYKMTQHHLPGRGPSNADKPAAGAGGAAGGGAAGPPAVVAVAGSDVNGHGADGGLNGIIASPSSDEYYPAVAIAALMRILRDPALSMHHSMVVYAVMVIFKSAGIKCVPFLPHITAPFMAVIRTCEPGLRDMMFQQLAVLVSVVKQHIRNYLPDLFALIQEYWHHSSLLIHILSLVEELATALNDDFKPLLLELLSQMLSLLHTDRSERRQSTLKVLHALEVFGRSLDDYVHLVVPPLVRLFDSPDSGAMIPVRQAAMHTLARLSTVLDLKDFASRILHPLIRVLDLGPAELRRDVMDTLCALVPYLGNDFVVFLPMINKVMARHRVHHPRYKMLLDRLENSEPVHDVAGLPSDAAAAVAVAGAGAGASMDGTLNGLGALALAAGVTAETTGAAQVAPSAGSLRVNQPNLKKAWETSQRSTKDDWREWMRRLSGELLRESPSPALRACSALAQVYHPLARELFNASFVSCWTELADQFQDSLVRALETAFSSENIPTEILQTLLNLAEFMEHDEKPLPIDIKTLGALAEKCHAYAKALHYKEAEFHSSPATTIEALISINNQLQQPEAAVGILVYAQQHHSTNIHIKESWYEKLQRWEDALQSYDRKAEREAAAAGVGSNATSPSSGGSGGVVPPVQAGVGPVAVGGSVAGLPPALAPAPALALNPVKVDPEVALGRMRCLRALGEWDKLSQVARETWRAACGGGDGSEPIIDAPESDMESIRQRIAPLAASAAWGLSQWDCMDEYVDAMEGRSVDGSFFRAIRAIHQRNFSDARRHIDLTRELLDPELTALVGESYAQSYKLVVKVQQLAELEEVIEYELDPGPERRTLLHHMWKERLLGCQRNVDVYVELLPVRALVMEADPNASLYRDVMVETYLRFASLCRKSRRLNLSERILTVTLAPSPNQPQDVRVTFALIKHAWAMGDQKDAYLKLRSFVRSFDPTLAVTMPSVGGVVAVVADGSGVGGGGGGVARAVQMTSNVRDLLAKCYLKLGEWRKAMCDNVLSESVISEMLNAYRTATEYGEQWYKAWHAWALNNSLVVSHYEKHGAETERIVEHLVAAVQGFFRSIALGRGDHLQDILRLLTLWFKHGHHSRVERALSHGFHTIPVDTWLAVIPQIIARIHTPSQVVRRLIHDVLVKVGRHHPQALIYPLTVASKSQSPTRRAAAEDIMNQMRQHSPTLVEQAMMVSQELIRVAILWQEMWHEGLEEASRLYFGDHNVDAMLQTLAPLHHMIDKGAETVREMSFCQAFGHDLQEALDWCKRFTRTSKEDDIRHAWDLYYHVFRRINKLLPGLTTLDLQYVSPKLHAARHLELAVPGTYRAGAGAGEESTGASSQPVVYIRAFAGTLSVIPSKQRPRKLTIQGSDGLDYVFLLKGHEDLRQDERVMQLFGLVNTLLTNDRDTAKRDLSIQRYAVIPLSPNSGLIGWVPNCDTLHSLIKDFREARKVMINVEHRLMLQMAPDYDNLTLIQKVEVFDFALKNTRGQDLNQVLWLKSKNAEVWLERRTNYTRSLAVMSMVGYILGLGDRHPSNLMLHRYTGKILHIDFGDCFEVAMHREKFPEKIPFRLTRMLVNAMEVSGIEGNFRLISESVLRVLRDNKDSVMAMLEAFVHDPLINWRLLSTNSPRAVQGGAGAGNNNPAPALPRNMSRVNGGGVVMPPGGLEGGGEQAPGAAAKSLSRSRHQRGDRERDFMAAFGPEGTGAPPEVLNERAVSVIRRVSNKLTGRDFGNETLDVPSQVDKLIQQACSHENLCQCYIGWCPFW